MVPQGPSYRRPPETYPLRRNKPEYYIVDNVGESQSAFTGANRAALTTCTTHAYILRAYYQGKRKWPPKEGNSLSQSRVGPAPNVNLVKSNSLRSAY